MRREEKCKSAPFGRAARLQFCPASTLAVLVRLTRRAGLDVTRKLSSPSEYLAYIASSRSNNVMVIDTTTRMHLATIPVGHEPLGVGEATAGPTAAAIGNAVAHALGTRIRDLPMTRERITATLLAG